MRVPFSWLLEYIDPGLSPQELGERMTMAGIEVEAVESFGSPLPGVVVGQVKGIRPHPGRDNLVLVDTDTGNGIHKIVCGAKNMAVGDKVAVARPGAVLPGGWEIKERPIYGVTSAGMLCSARELGLELGSDQEILILDKNITVEEKVDQVLGFDDQILCLDLTPNRADCLGMLGVAFEVAALTGGKVKMPAMNLPETEIPVYEAVKVDIDDRNLCPRYTARVIREIQIGPSPIWMQMRLMKAGVRPINNIVDISNYVMWETGQPLHAFDLQLLKERKILVRRARMGEKLITLDGVERALTDEDLVIADNNKPVGLAGVMGGENTEITAATREVLIEAAVFNPTSIRKTARRLSLPSEASQRFERGVNPEAVMWAQNRAALLLNELAGGKVLSGVVDENYSTVKPHHLSVSACRISRILGIDIDTAEVSALLDNLGFSISPSEDDLIEVTIPLRRADVRIEEDIVEEVARLYGYDRIPLTLPRGELIENREKEEERFKDAIKEIMISAGFYECIAYSFINPSGLRQLRLPDNDPRMNYIPVRNPFSEEQSAMRTTLVPGLLKAVQHNCSFSEVNQLLFEVGSVYMADSLPLKEQPAEKPILGMAVTGIIPEQNWVIPSGKADFFVIKGVLETIFKRYGIERVRFIPQAFPFTHPARSAMVKVDDNVLGFIGQIHPEVAGDWEIDQPVTVSEIDLTLLFKMAQPVPCFTPLPRYPAAKRDIAVIVDKNIASEELAQVIEEAGRDFVSRVVLFDLFEGKQIPAGKRSLAYSVTFRRDEGTLTDEEVNRVFEDIKNALVSRGAILRGEGT
ncbi:MAG: phenylalanine--tRNA ligase subunit beta [Bacillota bacterium]|nr:phenylalanine--tRNA ligase subunit beta [Bacillota bacterium]